MRFLFVLALLFSMPILAADTARVICGKDATFARLKEDWKFNKKENSYCASAHCPYPEGSMWREQCIRRDEYQTADNQMTIVLRDHYQSLQKSGTRSRVVYSLISKDDSCFNSCTPAIQGKKTVFGIERKSCVECLKQKTAAEISDTLTYPELERPLVTGTKCYSLCQDKPGPFTSERILTADCLSCMKERFYFISTKSGACLEVDGERKTRMVSSELCKAPNEVEFTEYRYKQSFWQSLADDKGDCFEVDSLSSGELISIPVPVDRCEVKNVNDADRNIIQDKQKTSPVSPSKTGAQKQ